MRPARRLYFEAVPLLEVLPLFEVLEPVVLWVLAEPDPVVVVFIASNTDMP